jgi:hypothetical protein
MYTNTPSQCCHGEEVKKDSKHGLSAIELACGIVVLLIAVYYWRDAIFPSRKAEPAPPAPTAPPSPIVGSAAKPAAAASKTEAAWQATEQGQLEAIKVRLVNALERQLKNPDSVMYRDVVVKQGWAHDQSGRIGNAVCGQYNAKDRNGIYAGYKTFYIFQLGNDAPTVWTTEDSNPSAARRGAESMGCQR